MSWDVLRSRIFIFKHFFHCSFQLLNCFWIFFLNWLIYWILNIHQLYLRYLSISISPPRREQTDFQHFRLHSSNFTHLALACGSKVEIFSRLINNSCCCCLLTRDEKRVISSRFHISARPETSSSARSQSNLVDWLQTDSINHLSLWTINAG